MNPTPGRYKVKAFARAGDRPPLFSFRSFSSGFGAVKSSQLFRKAHIKKID
jgi:hypothetical protein